MKVIRVNKNSQNIVIGEAVRIISSGGVVAYPTETAYGLGADFLNPKAVRKIYQIKGRDYKKPLSVIVSSLKMARQFARFNQLSLKLAKKYWPGALTFVLQITKKQDTKKRQSSILKPQSLALRISSNKLATAIVKKFGRPITATSANISGKGECFSAQEVISQFRRRKYQPDLVIDAGKLPKSKMSTVVQVVDGQIKVLRKGKILL